MLHAGTEGKQQSLIRATWSYSNFLKGFKTFSETLEASNLIGFKNFPPKHRPLTEQKQTCERNSLRPCSLGLPSLTSLFYRLGKNVRKDKTLFNGGKKRDRGRDRKIPSQWANSSANTAETEHLIPFFKN